jgi:uncharacterized membrane protein
MARSSRSSKVSSRPAAAPVRRPGAPPDWPIVILAALGALLTGYLTLKALGGSVPAFCTTGSGCDLVQQSRWSRLLGIPIALFGFGLYALLAIIAAVPAKPVKRWRRLWSLALIGLAISVYLTLLSVFSIQAFCGWCLASLLLIAAIFVVLNLRRPDTSTGFVWRAWLVNHAIVLVALLGVVYAQQSGMLTPPENPRLAALAEHLTERGAKFYGAEWCVNCRNQKELFGRSAERLPYVECSPFGPKGAMSFTCISAGVSAYPTWIIRGKPYTEVMQPEELARRSGFDWNGFDKRKEP